MYTLLTARFKDVAGLSWPIIAISCDSPTSDRNQNTGSDPAMPD